MYWRLAEDLVPGILHDSAGDAVVEGGGQKPVTVMLVVGSRVRVDDGSRGGELGTTANADGVGHSLARKELVEGLGVGFLRVARLVAGRPVVLLQWVDFIRAAQRPHTAEVGISLIDYMLGLQGLHQWDAVWKGC